MVPWAPLSSTVLALAALWRCWWSPSRVLWFRARQNRGNESAPPLAPRWVESPKRVARAPAKNEARLPGQAVAASLLP